VVGYANFMADEWSYVLERAKRKRKHTDQSAWRRSRILLCKLEGMTQAEAAQELRCTIRTIRNYWYLIEQV
jgi:hypothetical protein